MVAVIPIPTLRIEQKENICGRLSSRAGYWSREAGAILCKALVDLPWAGSSI